MMCIAPDATEEMRREDPLAVYHNGFFEQAVDAEAFRGVPPPGPPAAAFPTDWRRKRPASSTP